MTLLSSRFELHDVDDVEELATTIVRFSGLDLSHDEREQLVVFLVETAWELSLVYDPAGISSFRIFARRILRLRCTDWIRQHRGRTRWAWTDGSYERPRVQLVSLDTSPDADGHSLVDTLAQVDGDPAADSDADLRGLFAGRDRARSRDLHEIGVDAPRPAP